MIQAAKEALHGTFVKVEAGGGQVRTNQTPRIFDVRIITAIMPAVEPDSY
jgi:hypothetical protein